MIKNKKILITGATGFIGANITREFLKSGNNIFILTRDTSNKWRIKDILGNIKEYQVDLLNYEKLEKIISDIKPEIIFHTAVYGGFLFQREEDEIFRTNMMGTVNLLNACLKVGFDIFVNTGSSSEYGLKNGAIKESDMLEPITLYGVTKASATLFCSMKAKTENLPIVTLRLFSPYGYYEKQTRLIPSVIISCLKGENPQLSFPEPVRDFIFIEDVIEAYAKVVENKEKVIGAIFNVGCGNQHSVAEVVEHIIKLTDKKVYPVWGNIVNPRNEPQVWQADISKAKNILKWQPKHSLEEELSKTIKWFEENFSLYKRSIEQEIKL